MTSVEHDWQRLIKDMSAEEIRAADAYPALESLAPLIEAKRQDKPLIIAQLGQSLDGRIATTSGDSHYINGPATLDHLHRLRALVDAVIVGAGTIASDDPQLTVRRVPGPSPVRIAIDPSKRTSLDARWRSQDGNQFFRLIRHGDSAESTDIPVPCDAHEKLKPSAIVEVLAEQGIHRLLVEGGASTVSHWLQAGSLDRLHLLVGPLILGDGPLGLDLKPRGDKIGDAWRPETRTYPMPDGDVLIDCDLRADQSTG